MLKANDKERLKNLGIDIDAIIAAHTDPAEKDITVPDGEFVTAEQKATIIAVANKDGEKTGEKKAFDIAKVEIKKHSGIELKGERWGDVGKELKDAINIDKDTKYASVVEQNQALIRDIEGYKTKVETAETQLRTGLFEIGVLSKLPANAMGLSPKETFELAKLRGYTPEHTDAGVVWKKNGEVMKDPVTHAPLSEDKAIAAIWTEQKWTPAATPPAGGRGAGQKPSGDGMGGIMSKSAAEAAWREQNPDKGLATPEGMAWYAEQAKQPGFDLYT